MSSTREIKSRISSIKNTAQITKAMEVVSATKMRRTQERALSGRPYALSALNLLKNILKRSSKEINLFKDRIGNRIALIVVTADRGLAGAFNSNILKEANQFIKAHSDKEIDLIIIGKKGYDHFSRRNFNIIKSFDNLSDISHKDQTKDISNLVLDGFNNHTWSEVALCYTNFRTTLKQEVKVIDLLPLSYAKLSNIIEHIVPEYGRFSDIKKESAHIYEYKFEPNMEEVLTATLPILISIMIHHTLLEAAASEHSARMVAMKSAHDNAKNLLSDLNIAYNKSRQAGITRELIEIIAGVEALDN